MTRTKAACLVVLPVVLLAGLMLLTLLLAGCAREAGPAAGPKVYTRDEFHKEFMGATLDHVRAKLGAPDQVIDSESRWVYRARTRPNKPKLNRTGEGTGDVSLQHRDGRVYFVSYHDS